MATIPRSLGNIVSAPSIANIAPPNSRDRGLFSCPLAFVCHQNLILRASPSNSPSIPRGIRTSEFFGFNVRTPPLALAKIGAKILGSVPIHPCTPNPRSPTIFGRFLNPRNPWDASMFHFPGWPILAGSISLLSLHRFLAVPQRIPESRRSPASHKLTLGHLCPQARLCVKH